MFTCFKMHPANKGGNGGTAPASLNPLSPLDRAMTTFYRLSIVTMSPSTAVWP